LNPYEKGCVLTDQGLSDGRYAFGIIGDSWDGSLDAAEGAIGGAIGKSTVDFVLKGAIDPSLHSGWRVSDSWILRWRSTIEALSWDQTELKTVYSAATDPVGLPPHNLRFHHDTLIFEVASGAYAGLMSWTAPDGARPLVYYGNDTQKGAVNLGTDGVDLVWTLGEGQQELYVWDTQTIMTAPFTADPQQIAVSTRRVRSHPGGTEAWGFAVGCGYAAIRMFTPTDAGNTKDLFIVRLADGVSWQIKPQTPSGGLRFSAGLGVTCDHVYAVGDFPDEASTIIRIPLDSLGPGTPPD
jgi:hypothetical protein